jgi:hypothetical protein
VGGTHSIVVGDFIAGLVTVISPGEFAFVAYDIFCDEF